MSYVFKYLLIDGLINYHVVVRNKIVTNYFVTKLCSFARDF